MERECHSNYKLQKSNLVVKQVFQSPTITCILIHHWPEYVILLDYYTFTYSFSLRFVFSYSSIIKSASVLLLTVLKY